jgi:hypothetical protein
LMGSGHAPTPVAVTADEMHRFFDAKVACICVRLPAMLLHRCSQPPLRAVFYAFSVR